MVPGFLSRTKPLKSLHEVPTNATRSLLKHRWSHVIDNLPCWLIPCVFWDGIGRTGRTISGRASSLLCIKGGEGRLAGGWFVLSEMSFGSRLNIYLFIYKDTSSSSDFSKMNVTLTKGNYNNARQCRCKEK